jgi:uncharacterized protein (TIGR00369 family)
MSFTPADPNFETRIRASFATQLVMRTIGATMVRVEPGAIEIAMPFRADLTQQDGFLHAGIVATILDSACGYAAFSLLPAEAAVLTVEFKINLLRPAAGERFVARARVLKPGKTLTVCTGEVVAVAGGTEKVVASMMNTIMRLPDRE